MICQWEVEEEKSNSVSGDFRHSLAVQCLIATIEKEILSLPFSQTECHGWMSAERHKIFHFKASAVVFSNVVLLFVHVTFFFVYNA